jgi:hypothetical protein
VPFGDVDFPGHQVAPETTKSQDFSTRLHCPNDSVKMNTVSIATQQTKQPRHLGAPKSAALSNKTLSAPCQKEVENCSMKSNNYWHTYEDVKDPSLGCTFRHTDRFQPADFIEQYTHVAAEMKTCASLKSRPRHTFTLGC